MSTGHEIEQQIEAGEWEGYSEKQVWDIFGKIADNIADNVAKYHKIVHPRSCGTVFCEIFEDANYEDPIKISKYLTVSYVIAMSAHESKGFRRMLRVKKGIFR